MDRTNNDHPDHSRKPANGSVFSGEKADSFSNAASSDVSSKPSSDPSVMQDNTELKHGSNKSDQKRVGQIIDDNPDRKKSPDEKAVHEQVDAHPDRLPSGKELTSRPKRFGQILSVLNKYQVTKRLTPQKLRLILEDLGPTYVKLGQIMSSRNDMLPKEYITELQKLRSDVEPMDYETVRQIIVNTYGKPPEELFAKFWAKPLGSASMAQVHQAQTWDGENVVVKIQRPNIYEQMEVDIDMMRKAAKLVNLSSVISSVVDIDSALDEFWNTAKQELDFTQEAKNATRFRENYKDWKYIGAPKIHDQFTRRDVLVMDDIQGCEIDDYAQLEKEGYSREEIARKLAYNYIDQVINKGFFHADPHAGNIKIDDGKIDWIDFGMMGDLSKRDSALMKEALHAVAEGNTTKLTDAILAIGIPTKEVDYTGFYSALDQFMQRYLNKSLENIEMTEMVQEMVDICHTYGIMLPRGIATLARSLVTMEGTMKDLDPGINIISIIASQQTSISDIDWEQTLQSFLKKLYRSASASLDLPVQTNDVLSLIRKGQLKTNLKVLDLEQIMPDLNKMVDRIVVCVLIAALLMGSSIICTTELKPKFLDIPLLGFVGFFISFCLSIWLFVKMLFRRRGKNSIF